ncbi:MAG: polyhydroxyalkanoic acid system family protein [Thermoguttaceae bacterium]
MPKLTIDVPHSLTPDEAVQRLKQKFAEAKAEYGSRVNNLRDEWTDHTFDFSAEAVGMKVSGRIAVEPRNLRLEMSLPLAAMLFKRTIEDRIRQEVAGLLGS